MELSTDVHVYTLKNFNYGKFDKLLFSYIFSGKFAIVKKCLNKETNIEYAAKYIRKRRGGGRRGAKMEDIKKEVDILHQIDHPNIIQLYEVYETRLEVILVLELYVSSLNSLSQSYYLKLT